MRWFDDEEYSKNFLETLDEESFPFTFAMCKKNHFESFSNYVVVRKFINQEISYPLAIIIFEEVNDKEIHIYSLEVHKQYRLQDYGRKILSHFKEHYDKILLHTLDESKLFYIKNKFVEIAENEMIWKKEFGY